MNKRQLTQQIDQVRLLETVTKAYGEIAASRMKKTRDGVIQVRDFIDGMKITFESVRREYIAEYADKKSKITFLAHNGKKVIVLLSSNAGLYGDIVKSTYHAFSKELQKDNYEVAIVGKTGLALFKSQFPDRDVTFFEIPDEKVESSDLVPLIKHIVKYDEINLYFGKFQNIVTQVPSQIVISSHIDLKSASDGVPHARYLIEPDSAKVLSFFEAEIFSALFDQSIAESILAKLGSRILAMNRASDNILKEKARLSLRRLAIQRAAFDRKQRNRLVPLYSIL
jgi:F-type H+-transporting ATPase subunit gamma